MSKSNKAVILELIQIRLLYVNLEGNELTFSSDQSPLGLSHHAFYVDALLMLAPTDLYNVVFVVVVTVVFPRGNTCRWDLFLFNYVSEMLRL